MISEVIISNYKGIKNCEVKDLRRVNLFIGKNDSCKSSILEAMYHTCKEFESHNFDTVMTRRTDIFTGGRELWFNYDTKQNISVLLKFGDSGIELTLKKAADKVNSYISVSVPIGGGAITQKSEEIASHYRFQDFKFVGGSDVGLRLLRMLKIRRDFNLTDYVSDAVLIDCRNKSKLSDLESNLGLIKLQLKDEEFGEILESIYGKGKEWEFLPHPDAPKEKRIAFKEGGQRFFLSDFGDGFRFGLSICAQAVSMNGTAIFIEEIENHQHSGALKQLILALVDISRKNNLQLFITTHSNDVWNSISRIVYKDDAERENEEFRCFLVDRNIKTGVVKSEATDDVQKITKALGQI